MEIIKFVKPKLKIGADEEQRLRIKPIKIMISLSKILFAIYIICYFWFNYSHYTPKQLSNAFSQLNSISFKTADEIAIINDSTVKIMPFNAGFIRIGRDVLTFTNTAGQDVYEIMLTYDSPNLKIGNSLVLAYNSNSYEYEIISGIGSIYQGETKSRILNASINEDDQYLLVTDEQGYVSGLKLYSQDYKEEFQWFTAKYNIISAKSKDNNIGAICVNQEDNTFNSSLILFDKRDENYMIEVDLDGKFPIDLHFLDNSNIVLILEDSIYVVSKEGEILSIIETKNLKAYSMQNNHNIIYAEQNEEDIVKLNILDNYGKITSTIEIDYDIIDIETSLQGIYILSNDEIIRYDLELVEISREERDRNITQIIVHFNGELYGITSNRIIKH